MKAPRAFGRFSFDPYGAMILFVVFAAVLFGVFG
jgi:hypothetical protein